jgi:hypothetical protein
MTPQSKLEHIIYLVRKYEEDVKCQGVVRDCTAYYNGLLAAAGSTESLDPIPTIQPKAELYLQRIEAFLEGGTHDI